jgi:hypothetical protein
VPLGEREELRVPVAAIASVGQLDFVQVVGGDGRLARRYVRTGRRREGSIEVLAGLAAGEVVLADAGPR